MTVTVEIPDEMATRIEQQGKSVPEYLMYAAEQALETPGDVRQSADVDALIEEMFREAKGRFLGQSIRSAIDEGRRY